MKDGRLKFLYYDTNIKADNGCTDCYFARFDENYKGLCPFLAHDNFDCNGIFRLHKDFIANVCPDLR